MIPEKSLVLSERHQKPSTGLICSACGGRHLAVYRTVNHLHKIIRYRKCRHCGHTLTSMEKIVAK